MSLVINNNTIANSAVNELTGNYKQLARSTQRLSSGLRINSSADDAAGLAIRELMRSDISALRQGMRNTNDAISMVQTADGALAIIDEKLIRMKELAEQSATGTYNSVQRAMIDSEFQQMASEIERIAQATDFNGVKILNYQTVSGSTESSDPEADKYTATGPTTSNVKNLVNSSPAATANDPVANISDFSALVGTTVITVTNKNSKTLNGSGIAVTSQVNSSTGTLPNSISISWDAANNRWDVENYTRQMNYSQANCYNSEANKIYLGLGPSQSAEITIHTSGNPSNGDNAIINLMEESADPTYSYTVSGAGGSDSGDITLQNGSNSLDFIFNLTGGNSISQSFNVSGNGADAYTLSGFTITYKVTKKNEGEENPIPDDVVKIHFGTGNDSSEDYYYINKNDATLTGLNLNGVSIETQEKAQQALQKVDDAIVKKDQIRTYYGSMQNRLENTFSNLSMQLQNLQSSESRISDTDVASEMMNFVRNQILTQSAVAMLTQANNLPQMALRLIS